MFKYHLRLQISPNLNVKERIENMLDFCELAKIDDVIFFINAEDLFTGHVTVEEAKRYVDVILSAKKELSKRGVTVSLNLWTTLGHYDGGRRLKQGQNFRTMVGHNGVRSDLVACPLCENWRKYYIETLRFLVQALRPETVWLEDDFRLTNHETPQGLIERGCFCEEHLRLYNDKLQTNYDRKTFVSKLSIDEQVRKTYLDISRQTIENTLKYITNNVPEQKHFGLMTSGQGFEDGRRFGKLFDILSSGRRKALNRQALACYRQISGQQYMFNVNGLSLMVRTLTGEHADCVSEIENFPHGNYVKSVRFDKFQMLSAIPLLFTGATFSVFDFTGNGAIEYERLAKAYAQIKPFLSAVEEYKLLPKNGRGVKVLVSQDVAYTAKFSGEYVSGCKDSSGYFFAYLEMLGIACSYTLETELRNETIALSGQVIRALGKEKTQELFENNFVLLLGDGVEALFESGLERLISAKSFARLTERSDPHTMEEWNGDEKICGVTKLRATNHFASGDYVQVEYDNNVCIKAYTSMLNCFEKRIGNGITRVNNALIIPFYEAAELPYSLFAALREYAIKTGLAESGATDYCFIKEENVSPYVFQKGNETFLMCVNFSDDDYDELHICTDVQVNEWRIVTVENPDGFAPKIRKEKGGFVIEECLKGMESYMLIGK